MNKKTKQKKQETSEQNEVAQLAAALGRELRILRERKGFKIYEVASRLKLPARQIETLENGEYMGLPEPVFVRGFLRSYGRFLDMDDNRLNDYLEKIAPNGQVKIPIMKKSGINYANTKIKKSFPKWIFGVLALLILGVGVYAWQLKSNSEYSKQEENLSQNHNPNKQDTALHTENVISKPMTASDTATETVTASDVANQPPQAHLNAPQSSASVPSIMGVAGELVITTKYRTMLTVTDINGQVLLNKIVPANSEHRFKEGAPFDVRIGYAVGATATFAGNDIDIEAKRNGGKSVGFTAGESTQTQ